MRYAMLAILIILALEGANYAVAGLMQPDGAIHEIEGLIGLLVLTVIAAALYVGAAVTELKQKPPAKEPAAGPG